MSLKITNSNHHNLGKYIKALQIRLSCQLIKIKIKIKRKEKRGSFCTKLTSA